jgi:hypothetical protein
VIWGIKFLNLKAKIDWRIMRPKDATTRLDMSDEFYTFLLSQVAKLELKLPESATQDMFNSLNN